MSDNRSCWCSRFSLSTPYTPCDNENHHLPLSKQNQIALVTKLFALVTHKYTLIRRPRTIHFLDASNTYSSSLLCIHTSGGALGLAAS